jgi:hypothetical protein
MAITGGRPCGVGRVSDRPMARRFSTVARLTRLTLCLLATGTFAGCGDSNPRTTSRDSLRTPGARSSSAKDNESSNRRSTHRSGSGNGSTPASLIGSMPAPTDLNGHLPPWPGHGNNYCDAFQATPGVGDLSKVREIARQALRNASDDKGRKEAQALVDHPGRLPVATAVATCGSESGKISLTQFGDESGARDVLGQPFETALPTDAPVESMSSGELGNAWQCHRQVYEGDTTPPVLSTIEACRTVIGDVVLLVQGQATGIAEDAEGPHTVAHAAAVLGWLRAFNPDDSGPARDNVVKTAVLGTAKRMTACLTRRDSPSCANDPAMREPGTSVASWGGDGYTVSAKSSTGTSFILEHSGDVPDSRRCSPESPSCVDFRW